MSQPLNLFLVKLFWFLGLFFHLRCCHIGLPLALRCRCPPLFPHSVLGGLPFSLQHISQVCLSFLQKVHHRLSWLPLLANLETVFPFSPFGWSFLNPWPTPLATIAEALTGLGFSITPCLFSSASIIKTTSFSEGKPSLPRIYTPR